VFLFYLSSQEAYKADRKEMATKILSNNWYWFYYFYAPVCPMLRRT
jgi:hypothetical protein